MDKAKRHWRWHYLFTGFLFHLGALALTFVGLSSGEFFEANPSMAFVLHYAGWLGAIALIAGAYFLLFFFSQRRPVVAKLSLFLFCLDFSWDAMAMGIMT